ncbi:thioesterase II family protein [Streptomyces sp. URMC 126]|uniref:thioesterase II family protein n=1 Tax=Streptomyces sp. URMC 126 TaxID=3423401 RepID=UPI003F1A4389
MVTVLPAPVPAAPARPGPGVRLFCLPGAGSSAGLFGGWDGELPATVEVYAVEPPGRGLRSDERPLDDLDALLDDLLHAVTPHAGRPLALLGHSFGAVLAYELALRLEAAGAPVRHLFAVAARSPVGRTGGPSGRAPTDEELTARLRALGGTPGPVLDSAEMMALLLPAVRADFALADGYRHRPGRLLACPVTAFAGTEDRAVSPEAAGGWSACTRGRFTALRMPGGHFFPFSPPPSRTGFLHALARELGPYTGGTPNRPSTLERG